jgi:glycosyltransferase involved in cell wall biosynthesis
MPKKPMKVLVVSHMYPRPNNTMFGTFVRDKAIALKELGVDVRICAPVQYIPMPISLLRRYRNGEYDPTFRDSLPTIRIRWLTFPKRYFEATMRRHAYRDMVKAKVSLFGDQEPDLIHANDLFPDGYACARLAGLINIPLVVTSHGSDNRVHAKHARRRKAVLEAAEASSKIICVSEFVRRELIDLGLESKKMVTVKNGVDLHRIYNGPETNRIRNRFGNRMIILTVGHMTISEKGFDINIKTFAQLLQEMPQCNAVLVLVGDGAKRPSLESMVKRMGLHGRVFFEGAKSPEEVMHYMSACDLYCMPSWYEAFGIVYLEAMMHGKPVIAVQGQGISEVIEDGKTGLLVPPRDVMATCKALKRLIEDERFRCQIGLNGRNLVCSQYSQKHSAERTLLVYRDVLK